MENVPYTPRPAEALRELAVLRDAAVSLRRMASLRNGARGVGQPALFVPGLRTGDGATAVFRRYLQRRGFRTYPWGLGTNRGHVKALMPALEARAETVVREVGSPVALVGTSLGGYLARELARDRPDLVRRVVTLGAPVIGGPKYTQANVTYRRRGFDLDAMAAEVEARYQVPLNVPVTAIYSRGDGVVAWPACIDRRSPNVEHVEIASTHVGLTFHADALLITAERLARDR